MDYYDFNVDSPLQSSLVVGKEAIEEYIYLALGLHRNSMPFQERHSALDESLFTFITPVKAIILLSEIDKLLKTYAPRVGLIKSRSSVKAVATNGVYDSYVVTLAYDADGLANTESTTFTLSQ